MHLASSLLLAARRLARRPGLTASVVVTLALGIALNSTVFSVVRAVLLRPLPVPAPEELMFITREGDVSLLDAEDWRRDSRTFAAIALLMRRWALDWSTPDGATRLRASIVEPQYFTVLGIEPRLGRAFGAADGAPGAAATTVLGERYWRDRLAADPAIVGRVLVLSDIPTTVIGVMPAAADVLGDGVDLWVTPAPFIPWSIGERGTNNFDAIGRRRAEVSAGEAATELEAISQRCTSIYPATNAGKVVRPLVLLDFMVRAVRPALVALQAASLLLLVLAALHLGGLLLAHAVSRRADFVTRLALGAGRRRIVGELLAEAALLGTLGGLAGLVISRLGHRVLLDVLPAGLPRLDAVAAEPGAIWIGVALSLAVSVVLGGLVAGGVLASLGRAPFAGEAGRRTATAGRGHRRLLGAVVIAEVAVAALLLVGAGLLLRSFGALAAVPLGVEATDVTVASLVLPESRYGQREPQTAAITAIVERLAAIPGVASAAYVTNAPLEPRSGIGHRLVIEGVEPPSDGSRLGARHRPVLGDYFGTVGQRIVAGRSFAAGDDETAEPVAIVNQRFADALLGGQALDRRLAWVAGDERGPWMRVIGVAADVRSTTLDAGDALAVYTPYRQRVADWIRFGALVVRSTGTPSPGLPQAMRDAVAAVDATVPLDTIEPLAGRRRDQLAQPAFQSRALLLLAGLGLVLASQGIFATLAYAVAARRRELAVRSALGAAPRALLCDVLARAARLGGTGLGLGLLAAVALSRLLAALLFGVTPADPLTYGTVAVLLTLSALAAATLPGLAAARTEPAHTLRDE